MRDAAAPVTSVAPTELSALGAIASEEIREAIGKLGRTEDVQFSPSGDRVAIAAFHENRVLILRVEPDLERGAVKLADPLELRSRSFFNPHGICWVDEQTFIVANRSAEVAVYQLPANASGRVEIDSVASFGEDVDELLKTPGSVSVASAGLGLIELVVANNYVHHVSRHLIDRRDGYRLVASDVLAHDGLDVPDGVEFSIDGRWIAVSNHNHHQVLLFRRDSRVPSAVLSSVTFPHGLKFVEGDQALLVADAGNPLVHLYRSRGEWTGEMRPAASFRVLTDETFQRGSINPTEGGPKGVDVTPDGKLMVTSCHEAPLLFFDVSAVLTAPAPTNEQVDEAEQARATLLRFMVSDRSKLDAETAAIRRATNFELTLMSESRSWRITAPLRRAMALLRWIAPGYWARHFNRSS